MKTHRLLLTFAPILLAACSGASQAQEGRPPVEREYPERWSNPPVGDRLELSAEEWRARLTPGEFHVLREQGTEYAGTGEHARHEGHTGTFRCAGCGAPLFDAATKFESGTGWPSFWTPIEGGRVAETRDTSLGMVRVEVHCARCGGHLGHVFPDGPRPTGLRYCINSRSLDFDPAPYTPAGD
jgi:peptide-methionine (R)-S-oxide reductase